MLDDVYSMFPDTFMCHKIVSEVVKNQKSIIDIGGVGRLNKFLPDSVKVIDVNTITGGDGCGLHFSDRFFDVAVSINVLEHINLNKRFLFIEEALRVSRNYVVLCFPFQNASVCEKLKKSIGHKHPIADGKLPNLCDIISWIKTNRYEYLTYYGMPIPLHLALISSRKIMTVPIYKYINHLLEEHISSWICNSFIAQTVFLLISKNSDKNSFRFVPLSLE